MKSNNKFNLKKIIFCGMILLIVIFGVPFLAKLLEGIEFLGFTQVELLGYGGVLIGGAITFIVLKITNKTNNESLNKQIESQKEIVEKQFEFNLKQKQVKELEIELKNILDNCRISKNAIRSFNKIPKYLSINTLDYILEPLLEFFKSIGDLVLITNDVYNKFELALNSFIIIDELINCEEYKAYKFSILNYVNNYLNIIGKLNQEIESINNLIEIINYRKQVNPIYYIFENDMGKFANLKSSLDYYIGSHNAFRVVGWMDLNKSVSEFIRFLNRYIMNSVNLKQ